MTGLLAALTHGDDGDAWVSSQRQLFSVALAALLLVSMLSAPVAGVAAAQENSTSTPTATPTDEPADAGNETTNETQEPGIADAVRIFPVRQPVDFLYVNEHERGQVYNTSGPFVEFELDRPVDRVQIVEQSGARAEVYAGGRMVRVDYEEDAAPVGSSSLYQLRLYFEDGSERTLELYASETSVDVAERQMRAYRPFILQYQDEAEAAGYGRDPGDLMDFKEERDRKLQYIDMLFIDKAFEFVQAAGKLLLNPITYIVGIIALALVTFYSLRRFGWMHDLLSKGAGEAQRLHQTLWNKAKEEMQTAKEEPISEIRHVSMTDETIFEDAFGVDTVLDVAELARNGVRVQRDGEVQVIGGIHEIDPANVHDSWLNELCRDTRYTNPQTPLTVMKHCLNRMCNKYAQTQHYKETLTETKQLIDELDASRDNEHYRSHASLTRRQPKDDRSGVNGAASGGDD